jgi:hypothetical protein
MGALSRSRQNRNHELVFHDPLAKWPDDPILDGPMTQ